MERLKCGVEDPYNPIDASIHVGRYALALPFAAGRRVLDVACGEGYGSWLLAEAGADEVVGVDISADAVGKARETFRHERLRFETGAGEALADALPAGHFDLVVSIETIEHVADPEAFLRALRRVATPDAVFVLTCPNDHWYYGDAAGNPYHLRRFTLDEFKALTIPVLGERVQWLLGSATLGFSAVAVDHEWPADPVRPRLTQIVPLRLALRVPSAGAAEPSPTNCSYFVGIWNALEKTQGAGAQYVLSMDDYSRMMGGATSAQQFAELQSEVTALRSRQGGLLEEIAALRAERDALSASLAALRAELDARVAEAAAAFREREIVGLQAAALRRENEVLSSQLQALRTELDTAQRQVADLQTSLAWHVARIQNLEGEPLGRLLRRAAGRIVRRFPPLYRLAVRLRQASARPWAV